MIPSFPIQCLKTHPGVRRLAAAFIGASLLAPQKFFGSQNKKEVMYAMTTSWHHSPPHRFVPGSTYMITGATLNKEPFFHGPDRLEYLQDQLLAIFKKHGWEIHAWAVFPNHHHLIARAPENGASLSSIIRELHSVTAHTANQLDLASGRQVWFQYWDTCLTFEESWLVRLNYVNNNAVHHGLVANAVNYPYCSATWFQQKADRGFQRKVNSFRYDRLRVIDDF
jgi:putative transposase